MKKRSVGLSCKQSSRDIARGHDGVEGRPRNAEPLQLWVDVPGQSWCVGDQDHETPTGTDPAQGIDGALQVGNIQAQVGGESSPEIGDGSTQMGDGSTQVGDALTASDVEELNSQWQSQYAAALARLLA